jgi:hypothetical protein
MKDGSCDFGERCVFLTLGHLEVISYYGLQIKVNSVILRH